MDFCMQIVKHLMLEEIKDTGRKNTILSPLSINVILNMIAVGTTDATLELILRHLKYESVEEIIKKSHAIMNVANNMDEVGPIVTSINGVWSSKNYPLKASYEALLKGIYNCEANKSCDFENKGSEITKEINSWAKAASRGLIENVLESPVHPMTVFVRANALYFKGSWCEPFDPDDTRSDQFYLLENTIVKVPFLHGPSMLRYQYGSFDGYKVLKVPYESGPKTRFSMYFFLPDEMDGLPNILELFKSDTENSFLNLDLNYTDFDLVRIPKFKFPYKCDTIFDTMENMGLEIPYKGNKLDYAETIQNPEDITATNNTIIQKAFIEIDEYGTEASAVTVDTLMGCSMDYFSKPKERFVADHPFMFVIKEDNSGSVFFTGLVLKPAENEGLFIEIDEGLFE